MKHIRSNNITTNCTIDLVGCGGTGSMVLGGLVRLVLALRSIDGPKLDVVVYDPDRVSQANVGRQLYYPGDIDQNKAAVSINRINIAFGLDFRAIPEKYDPVLYETGNIVIGCVDTRKSRKKIREVLDHKHNHPYYIDCGNGDRYGQVLIGNGSKELPWPWEVLPDLVSDAPDDDGPSCSLAEALESQDLFINQEIALCALKLLWSLFRYGGLDHRGYFINQKTGKHIPVLIDKDK